MTDILTRLSALMQKDENGLLPCRCGAKGAFDDYSTASPRITCHICGNDFLFPIFTTREHKRKSWNVRECDAALIALVRKAAGEIERLTQWQTLALAIGEREEERIKERELEEEEPGHD